jgi:hypothetical protein
MIVLRKPYRQHTTVIVADELAGALDGVNRTFRTTYKYKRDRITVYYNGQALHAPYDFDQTGEDEIVFVDLIPQYPDEKLRATYELEGFEYGIALKGQLPIPMGVSSKQVVFSTTLTNIFYSVSTELTSTDGNPSVYSYVIANKTVNGFMIYFSGVIDTPNYILDWAVRP